MRLFIVLLLAALSAAQYQQRRHYGYQNPYQYHPYMRYHNYNHPPATHEEPVEQPHEEQQQPAPRHHPYHQARRYHGYERQQPVEPVTTPAPKHHRQPHHYSAYQQRPAAPHHGYGRYHRPAAAAARPQHNSVEPAHEAKPAAHHEERGEPVYLGTFKNPTHEVKGDIFMLDDHTLYIQGFSFDGQAPDVYFWSDGVPIPYYTRSNNHVTMNVHEYKDEDIVLMLPPEKPTLDKMRKFQVWCKQFGINFGEFSIDG